MDAKMLEDTAQPPQFVAIKLEPQCSSPRTVCVKTHGDMVSFYRKQSKKRLWAIMFLSWLSLTFFILLYVYLIIPKLVITNEHIDNLAKQHGCID